MGSVLVNGKSRQVIIHGNPIGRTVIQVDGMTVYDKTPIIVEKAIDFDLAPGKKASLQWHQATGLNADCVVVDGSTTKLTRLPDIVDEAEQKVQLRIGGGLALLVAAGSFWWNYSSLRNDGAYYPKALALIPCLTVMGIASFLHPRVNLSLKNRNWQVLFFVAGLGLAAFGFTMFTDWFLAAFSK
jgi:hypothetical protein